MARSRISKLFFGILPAFAFFTSHQMLLAVPTLEAAQVSFEKLPACYTVSYGDPGAPIKITEYFSFSCPKCLEFIRRDFELVKTQYIDTGKVYWTFHPDPADVLTLQAMVCFELLDNLERQSFLKMLADEIRIRSIKKTCFKMQEKMNALGKPLPMLHDLSYLESTEAFNSAYTYLKQPDVPSQLPTVEIDKKIYQEFPSLEWMDQILMDLQILTNIGAQNE